MSQQNQGARPTKAERKDEARRRRLELERRMATAKRNRWIGVAVAAVVVVGVVAFAVTRPKESAPRDDRAAQLLAVADSRAQAAGCTTIDDVGPYQPEEQDQAHVGDTIAAMPPLTSYPSQPPASGPHGGGTLAAGVYGTAPPLQDLIHSLEHGAAIVWYAPDAPAQAVDELRGFFGDGDVGSRVIVAPYDYPDEGAAGILQQGAGMALVAWHHVQTCTEVDLAAAFGFTARYAFPTFEDQDYLGVAPEPGAPL